MGISSRMNRMGIRKKATYPANTTVLLVDTQYGYTHQLSVTGTNISIDWGDGTTEEISSANNVTKSHTYSDEKVYTIQITNATNFRHSSTNNILINVIQVGDTITSLSYAFAYSLLTELNIKITSNITSLNNLCINCSSLKTVNTSKWDTSMVTNVQGSFYWCSNLIDIGTINWDLSKVTNMSFFFSGCYLLSTDITHAFDTLAQPSISVQLLFYYCRNITGIVPSELLWNNPDITFSDYANCFNFCVALNNYNEIPSSWGGGMV